MPDRLDIVVPSPLQIEPMVLVSQGVSVLNRPGSALVVLNLTRVTTAGLGVSFRAAV